MNKGRCGRGRCARTPAERTPPAVAEVNVHRRGRGEPGAVALVGGSVHAQVEGGSLALQLDQHPDSGSPIGRKLTVHQPVERGPNAVRARPPAPFETACVSTAAPGAARRPRRPRFGSSPFLPRARRRSVSCMLRASGGAQHPLRALRASPCAETAGCRLGGSVVSGRTCRRSISPFQRKLAWRLHGHPVTCDARLRPRRWGLRCKGSGDGRIASWAYRWPGRRSTDSARRTNSASDSQKVPRLLHGHTSGFVPDQRRASQPGGELRVFHPGPSRPGVPQACRSPSRLMFPGTDDDETVLFVR